MQNLLESRDDVNGKRKLVSSKEGWNTISFNNNLNLVVNILQVISSFTIL